MGSDDGMSSKKTRLKEERKKRAHGLDETHCKNNEHMEQTHQKAEIVQSAHRDLMLEYSTKCHVSLQLKYLNTK